MSSAQKRMIINTRERGVSGDINSLQDFIAAERNEILYAIASHSSGSYITQGASDDHPSGTPTGKPYADVFTGLEMIVDNPGSVLVTPGVIGQYLGDPASGDSGYLVAIDPGVQTTGVLTLAINSSAYPRCDVIEVQVIDVLQSSQSRDVFDETTGLFSPSILPKVRGADLTYRVRLGTPGSCPGFAAGWTPIGLAIVPNTGVLTAVDFYDVRPLVRERLHGYGASSQLGVHAPVQQQAKSIYCNKSAGFSGFGEVDYMGIRLGGAVNANTPLSADGAAVALGAGNYVNGVSFSPVSRDLLVLGVWMPLFGSTTPGFHRFCRYSQGTVNGRRRPTGSNGLFLIHAMSQYADVGSVFTPRTLNASGIGGVLGTAFGVPLALTTYSSSASAALTSYTKGNQTVFGGLVEFGYGVQQSQFNTPILAFTFTRNYFSITVDFASGSFGVSTGGYFPTMFRRARVAFQFLVTLGTVADGLYMVLLNFFTSEDADLTHQDPSTNAFGFGSSSFSLAVPVQINGGAHQGTVIGTVDVDLTAWNDSSEAGRAGTFLHIAAASLAGSVTVASDLTNAATVTAVELP